MKKLRKPISIITGNGPLLAIIQGESVLLYQFDEHHGWRYECVHYLTEGIRFLNFKSTNPSGPY